MLKPHIFAIALAATTFSAAGALAATPVPGVDLLSAGPSAIRIGVTAPEPELVAADSVAGAPVRRRIRLAGWDVEAEPGKAAIPSRVLRVAVPPAGPVSVSAFGLASQIREGVDLEISGFADPRRPASASLAPVRARLLGVSWMRNQRVASIAVLPVDYEPAARRLTWWSRLEIEVSVAASGPTATPFETSDPFEDIYAATLVNYEQGKAWRRPAAGGLSRLTTSVLPARGEGSAIPTAGLFAGHTWVKVAIPKSGFYRINYGQLRALAPFSLADSIAFDRLRVFGWPGRPVLSEQVPSDTRDYRQIAVAVEDVGGDNKLANNGDAFLFYAQGSSDWANHFDPSFDDTTWIQHPYDLNSFVFLSFDSVAGDRRFTDPPLRIVANSLHVTPSPDGTENQPVSFRERLRFEQDSGNEYFPSIYTYYQPPVDGDEPWSWQKFFWRTISINGQFLQSFRTPAPLAGTPAYVRTRAWGTGTNPDQVCPVYHPSHLLDVAVWSPVGYDSTQDGFLHLQPSTTRLFPVLDTVNTHRIHIPSVGNDCVGRIDQSSLDWFEVYYQRRFVPENDALTFDSPGNGNAIYTIGPFVSTVLPRMFDITDPFAPVEMQTDSAGSFGTTHTLRIEVNESGPRRYAFVPVTSFLKPAATDLVEASGTSSDDLRGTNHTADYVVIYYDGFQLAADSLVAWRTTRMPLAPHPAPYHAVPVPVSAIFDQFSGGRVDPVAIRSFLRAVYFNWSQAGHAAPGFVTLLGDASFDYRNLLGLARAGQPGCLLTSFENNTVGGTQYSTDDWLTNVDDVTASAIPEFVSGRIPAPDATSALDYVRKKLLFYERSAPTGAWRNRVMLIADDDKQGERPDGLQWTHLAQTARLDTVYTPQHVDRYYIYLHTYPDGPGRTKPAAKADIKNTINGDGVVMFNYIGHGSPFKLSDENVLIDTDAGSFVNASKLPLFVAASCDVGKFNDPRVQSLGERLLLGENGGTIGVISATELAYSQANIELNNALYANLFNRSAATGQFWQPVGSALLAAKIATSTSSFTLQNNQKYTLMSDAALKLDLPKLWVDVAIYDETGTTLVTELHGGQTLVCKGTVLDRQGGSPVAYSGIVDLLIEDSTPRQTSPDCDFSPGCARATYDFRAGAIFRGDLLVSGGSFSGKFVVPIEARGGPRGRVRAYVAGLPTLPPQIDGVGSRRLQVSPGTAPTDDQSGPTISLSFAGGVTSVKPDAVLRIELTDASGILTTAHTVQNGIVVTVDDNTTARVDVTGSFRYAAGSYTTGTATFTLPHLAPGPHTVSVSAADNLAGGLTAFQHRSSASLAFEVATAPPISIRNAYLFPNPTESGRRQSGGVFVVDGPGDSANVMVRLYTISGRMIRELKSLGTFGQVQVRWDGYDAEGFPLANGTYLFKVYVNGRDEKGRSSARQAAAREGRFVILNH